MSLSRSAISGYLIWPSPPSLRGVFRQARCVKWLSTEQPRICTPNLANSSARSEKAMISVGQTKVKSKRIEEQQDVLALVVRQADLLERAVRHDGLGLEIRSGLLDENTHDHPFLSNWFGNE